MHSLLHPEHARTADADQRRRQAGRERRRALPPDAPPSHTRALVAHVLGSAAGRVDREAARRAVA